MKGVLLEDTSAVVFRPLEEIMNTINVFQTTGEYQLGKKNGIEIEEAYLNLTSLIQK